MSDWWAPTDEELEGEEERAKSEPCVVTIKDGDPRYCQLEMHDVPHAPHRFEYEYDRPEHLGGHTHGYYDCPGVIDLVPVVLTDDPAATTEDGDR